MKIGKDHRKEEVTQGRKERNYGGRKICSKERKDGQEGR